ncbi:MAG: hypothetical protein FJY85_06415 [Deltaproteobacteria bacterium]|nr:hypothetical protein [Deltaproteobacteria bacterium]
MESMNLLDITIKYFNVIVFVLCVIFGMISLLASWVAWREIHKKKNIIRSVIAAYNITEDGLEKGQIPDREFQLDPAIVQTILNSLGEILNAVYGEVTGKPMPPREERAHGSRKASGGTVIARVFRRKGQEDALDVDKGVPTLITGDREHHRYIANP